MNSENSEHVLDLEQIPDGEDEAIRKVVDLELQILQKRIDQEHLGTSERPVTRAQHPKQHGCVKAEFVIADHAQHHGDVQRQHKPCRQFSFADADGQLGIERGGVSISPLVAASFSPFLSGPLLLSLPCLYQLGTA